ncbi:MAG: rod shape-determining protein MreD [Bacteroidales bacterium]|jgi:hypothetical protein|nr:rod shape-determining protein MreD [Bacteroidales bacterium]MCI1732968.1 rod shape-determining protein MreD [Bacteroidales bacterium]
MNDILRYTVIGIAALIIQLLICEFVNIWPPLYIAVFPLFIMMLPADFKPGFLMLTAFIAGLLIDALSDGLLGLNATSLTAVAFFKRPLMKSIARYEAGGGAGARDVNSKHLGFQKFFTFLLLSYSIFFVCYVILDDLGSGSATFLIIRLLINIIANLLIAIILEKLFFQRLMQ